MGMLNEITITGLQTMYKERKISVKEAVQEYINRINQYDKGENGLNSILEINPEALKIAETLDNRHDDKHPLLYGVPVLLKDNIDTADKLHTSAGSLVLADSIAIRDAPLVAKLREKGAVILGKTNMTEYANFMSESMKNGYSSRGGQVEHPYVRGKDVSGSSTGSAVAVTANLCTASVGTDTCNSILGPGLTHGIVGFRPSTGAISPKGIIPISFTLDTAGPFARTVADAALMIAGMTGKAVIKDSLDSVKGKRIGYNEWIDPSGEEEVLPKAEEIIRELEKAGAIIKRLTIPKTPHIFNVMLYEFKYAINAYLKTLPEDYPIKTLTDIIEFNKKDPVRCLKYGQDILEKAEQCSGQLKEAEYLAIKKDREENMVKIREQFRDVDICIMKSYSNILQYTALPGITIPCGLDAERLPVGIYMTARTDTELLMHAYSVERAVGNRVAPKSD